MAILKDLIVNGATRLVGDAYMNTIKSGTWNGSPIAVANGGTGATTAATARTNLGLGAASTYGVLDKTSNYNVTSSGTGLTTERAIYYILANKGYLTASNLPVVFTGATASANGTQGLVPAPTAGKQNSFLRGDGSWSTPEGVKQVILDSGGVVVAFLKVNAYNVRIENYSSAQYVSYNGEVPMGKQSKGIVAATHNVYTYTGGNFVPIATVTNNYMVCQNIRGYGRWFENLVLSSIEFTDNFLVNIPEYSFYNCLFTDMLSLSIPSHVKVIGDYAFANQLPSIYNRLERPDKIYVNSGSEYITVANYNKDFNLTISSQTLGYRSFYHFMVGFKSCNIKLENTLTIGDEAFSQDIYLGGANIVPTVIDIPNTIQSIGTNALLGISTWYCRAATPPILKSQNISVSDIISIKVPSASVNAYKTASGWSTYASKITAI